MSDICAPDQMLGGCYFIFEDGYFISVSRKGQEWSASIHLMNLLNIQAFKANSYNFVWNNNFTLCIVI